MLLLGAEAKPAHARDNTVAVAAWAEYVPSDVIDGFEAETGIKVVYDYFDSLETLETKMLTGNSGYDVVFPSALVANRLIQVGTLKKLEKGKLSNLGNLDPEIMGFLERHDEGNQYGVPYLWGTTGVIHNPALVFERMEYAPIDSLDPFTSDPADFEKVDALLASIKPHIRHFKTGAIINKMASGDLCLVLGWSGDAGLAYASALEAENGVEVFCSVPKEGTEVFFDFLSVPADAPNPDKAHAFIDYLMKPEVIAGVTNLYCYPNGNAAALVHVLDEVNGDPNVYPTEEMMATLFPNLPRDQKTLRVLTRTWTRFKTGI